MIYVRCTYTNGADVTSWLDSLIIDLCIKNVALKQDSYFIHSFLIDYGLPFIVGRNAYGEMRLTIGCESTVISQSYADSVINYIDNVEKTGSNYCQLFKLIIEACFEESFSKSVKEEIRQIYENIEDLSSKYPTKEELEENMPVALNPKDAAVLYNQSIKFLI